MPGCGGFSTLDALHVPCLLLEVANQLRLLDLAAKDDDTVLGIDVDLAFGTSASRKISVSTLRASVTSSGCGLSASLSLDLLLHVKGLRLRNAAKAPRVADLLPEEVDEHSPEGREFE